MMQRALPIKHVLQRLWELYNAHLGSVSFRFRSTTILGLQPQGGLFTASKFCLYTRVVKSLLKLLQQAPLQRLALLMGRAQIPSLEHKTQLFEVHSQGPQQHDINGIQVQIFPNSQVCTPAAIAQKFRNASEAPR